MNATPLPASSPPAHHLLLIDDDLHLLRLLSLRLQANGYRVSTAPSLEAARALLGVEAFDLVLSDVRLPDGDGLVFFDEIRRSHPTLPVILLTAHGTIPDAVDATARGVADYLTKPYDRHVLLARIRQLLALAAPAPAGRDESWRADLHTHSKRMQQLLEEARLVAATDASVLIRGASGSGKEVLARAIHRASLRAAGPFIALNCAAIPENLLESELFGHLRGAFTGALQDRPGLFQAASGGTLFLDEIGDMPATLQAKLLRVLQEGMVRPLGAIRSQPTDARIIAATHRDLDAAISAGDFREDLYYRINVVSLELPSLDQRREDIPLLAEHFLRELAHKHGKALSGFSPAALEALVRAQWPGNVRQLRNVIEQICVLATTALVPRHLVDRALRVPPAPELPYVEAKRRFEQAYLVQLLKLTAGNVTTAARLAERNRTEFYRLLQRHGLSPRAFRDPDSPGLEA